MEVGFLNCITGPMEGGAQTGLAGHSGQKLLHWFSIGRRFDEMR